MEAASRKWVLVSLVALLVLAAGFLATIYAPTHGAIADVDGVYEAQVAWNVLQGHGYVTNEEPLYAVYYTSQHGGVVSPPWTNNLEFPLPIFLKVVFLAASSSNLQVATTGFSVAFFLLSLVLLYSFVYGLRRRLRPAVFATVFVATNPLLLTMALNGKGDSLDLFLFLLSLWFIFRALPSPSGSNLPVIVAGTLTGLTLLAMYSQGLFMGFAFAFSLGWLAGKRSAGGWRDGLKVVARFLGGAAVVLVPTLTASWALTGTALPSGNLLLQLVSFTPSVKFMNAWWKLGYPSQAGSLVAYSSAYRGQLWSKSLTWGASTLSGFASLGYLFTSVSIWWLPVGYAVFLYLRKSTSAGLAPKDRTAVSILGWTVVSNLGLAVAVLSPLAGSLEYVAYLLPAVFVIGAIGLDEGTQRLGRVVRAATTSGEATATTTPRRSYAARLGARRPSIAKALSLGLPIALTVLIVLPSAAYEGLIPGYAAPTPNAPNWYTDQDPAALALVGSLTGPDQVAVTAEPWNVAWYDHRNAVALPEYPDDVYALLGLGMNISAVYVANLNSLFFQDVSAPYTYDSYVQEATFGYSISGFTVAHNSETVMGPDLVLARNLSVPLSQLLNTRLVPFGDPEDSSHLVWGWSPDVVINGTNANWAGEPGGLPTFPAQGLVSYGCGGFVFSQDFCLPPVNFTGDPTTPAGAWEPISGQIPEAEVTFLVQGTAPSTVTVQLLSPVANQTIALVVNANVVSFYQPGTLVGAQPVGPAGRWANLSFAVPPGTFVQGLNVLDFLFSTSSSGGSETGGLTTAFAAFHQVTFS